jgi:hypothetical protein
MKTNWIEKYKVEKNGEKIIVSGFFTASAGTFTVEYQGDGGNADTYEITLTGPQYEMETGKPLTFTITGAWEFREVTEMFKLLDRLQV